MSEIAANRRKAAAKTRSRMIQLLGALLSRINHADVIQNVARNCCYAVQKRRVSVTLNAPRSRDRVGREKRKRIFLSPFICSIRLHLLIQRS